MTIIKVDPYIIDALKEIVNIGAGRSAALLAEMTHRRIVLTIPDVQIINSDELCTVHGFDSTRSVATVSLVFKGVISGQTALMIPPQSAANLVSLLVHEEYDKAELDAVMVETLKEVGNIIVNGIMGSISNILGERFTYSVPVYQQASVVSLMAGSRFGPCKDLIIAHTLFRVHEGDIEGNILVILELGSLDVFIDRISEISRSG